jgi:hypothetical protein
MIYRWCSSTWTSPPTAAIDPTTASPPSGLPGPRPRLDVDRRELESVDEDILVTKHQTGVSHGPGTQLRRRGITGCPGGGHDQPRGGEHWALASDLGHNVTFAADAMTDADAAAHDHSLRTTFPMFGEVDSTEAIPLSCPLEAPAPS